MNLRLSLRDEFSSKEAEFDYTCGSENSSRSGKGSMMSASMMTSFPDFTRIYVLTKSETTWMIRNVDHGILCNENRYTVRRMV